MRTTPNACNRKKRFVTRDAAVSAGRNAPFHLNPYRCDLCREYHLTSRTKGMFVARRAAPPAL